MSSSPSHPHAKTDGGLDGSEPCLDDKEKELHCPLATEGSSREKLVTYSALMGNQAGRSGGKVSTLDIALPQFMTQVIKFQYNRSPWVVVWWAVPSK